VRVQYAGDGEVMSAFYQFVQKEELVLDEAEMPAEQFAQKMLFVQSMQEEMRQHQEQVRQMTPQQQQAFMVAMSKRMMSMQTSAADQAALGLTGQVRRAAAAAFCASAPARPACVTRPEARGCMPPNVTPMGFAAASLLALPPLPPLASWLPSAEWLPARWHVVAAGARGGGRVR
jgi:hypothetical protein